MSRLHLNCRLCGRTQADGLLSRAAWGHLSLTTGTTLQACPNCRSTYTDWETRLRATTSASTDRPAERRPAF